VTDPIDVQLQADLLTYGSCWYKFDADGNRVRIHPADVYRKPPRTCGHAAHEHGQDPEYPRATSCYHADTCGCEVYEPIEAEPPISGLADVPAGIGGRRRDRGAD